MNSAAENQRSLGAIVSEMQAEVKDFVQTRIDMLRQEVHTILARIKTVAPVLAGAVLLLGTAYLLFTLAIVSAVSAFFAASPYRWAFGFAMVGFVWALLGGVAAYVAKRELEIKSLAPRRTLEVLKGDKVWLKQEVKRRA